MRTLDDEKFIAEVDSQGMRDRIRELPDQCVDAWKIGKRFALPPEYRSPQKIVILGMGGSAIGGALLAGLVADECPVPILSVGGYDVPAYVGPKDVVIASSYSGNTEETLSATAQAAERGARVLAVTTGGKLGALAEERGWPLLRFEYNAPPRAALGYSFTLLLALLYQMGLIRDCSADLEEAVEVMRAWQKELTPDVPVPRNPAKRMAGQLVGRLPVVYGAGFLAPVARRWKGQFNENAKNWAVWEELPELNHNAVVGYGTPDEVCERIAVVILRSPLDPPRIQARWEVTKELLLQEGVMLDEAWARGDSRLAQMLSIIHFGDYVSLYLAVLNEADPYPVPPIDYLKRRLAEMG